MNNVEAFKFQVGAFLYYLAECTLTSSLCRLSRVVSNLPRVTARFVCNF